MWMMMAVMKKAMFVVILTMLALGLGCVCASDNIVFITFRIAAVRSINHSVGGESGWRLSSNLRAWANRTTFHVGDSLVFRYTRVYDVVEVSKLEYDLCEILEQIERNRDGVYSDGETVIRLREPGNRFFIGGSVRHCASGLKLHVKVLPAAAVLYRNRITTTWDADEDEDDDIGAPASIDTANINNATATSSNGSNSSGEAAGVNVEMTSVEVGATMVMVTGLVVMVTSCMYPSRFASGVTTIAFLVFLVALRFLSS